MINPLDVPVVFSQRPASLPSTVYDSRTSMVSTPTSPMARVVDDHKGMSLWGKFFRSMSRLPIGSANMIDHKNGILNYPAPVYPVDSIHYPIELKSVDLNLSDNSPKHRTDYYQNNGKLVLRRGQYFDLDLTFYRSYEPERDCLKLIFEIGSQPSIPDQTRIVLNVENGHEAESKTVWRAEIIELSDVDVRLRVYISPHAILGAWNLKIIASLLNLVVSGAEFSDETDACPVPNALLDSQSLVSSVYILYNPWCEDDSVYMENEDERDFFVLKDIGIIWRGCFNSPAPHNWAYGQFEEGILDASLAVLERSRLPLSHRSSPTHVAKTIAEMINSVSDTGIIVGNWTQSFDFGISPTDWTGSSRILLQYAQTGQPVCFGHCYTFAGLVTTILRCFGMPCRVVTNYGSAHDSANMVSVNMFVRKSGKLDFDRTKDTLWSFHTWNECWMRRPDLPERYSGWQALDATPQEKSSGFYCTGPASVQAVKEGAIGFGHDTQCFYTEINAIQTCFLSGDDCEKFIDVECMMIGRLIITSKTDLSNTKVLFDDITDNYKNGNRLMSRDVMRKISPTTIFFEKSQSDLEISIDSTSQPKIAGQNFSISVILKNLSDKTINVKFWVRVESVLYHCSAPYKIKAIKMHRSLHARENAIIPVTISLSEYLGRTLHQSMFAVTLFVEVQESNAMLYKCDYFQLEMPKLMVEEHEANVNKSKNSMKGKILMAKLVNPLPVTLTRCKFLVEGPGIVNATEIHCKDAPPHGTIQCEISVTPREHHNRRKCVIFHFTCDQLNDIEGHINL